MGFGRFLILEMDIVGADELDAIVFGKLHEHMIGLLLQRKSLAVGHNRGVGHLVALHF